MCYGSEDFGYRSSEMVRLHPVAAASERQPLVTGRPVGGKPEVHNISVALNALVRGGSSGSSLGS